MGEEKDMKSLKLSEVRQTEGLFKEREKLNRDYLMELDNRALLQNFYLEAGIMLPGLQQISDPDDTYIHWGWESPTCQLRGHFLGHWMSAAAHLAVINKDRELEAKLYTIVDELKICQKANGGQWIGSIPEKYMKRLENKEYIWSPQYTLHTPFMVLFDAYACPGYAAALSFFSHASDWYVDWVKHLKDKPEVVVKGEAGGMLEIWARLYGITGKEKYLKLADAYSVYSDFALLAKGEDALTDNHANASIPEAHGAACMYEVTGDEKWLKLALAFWKQAKNDREAYATGGQNAGEFWIPPHHFYEAISERTQEFCTMYNMVRLAEYLYRFTGKREYSDYIERILYNAFLAQQNKVTGMPTYFLPLRYGSRKQWGNKTRSFWCCTGTMVQAQTLYASLIYYKDEEKRKVSVEQYINSEASFALNQGKVSIRQEVDMTYCSGALFGEEKIKKTKSRWSFQFTVSSSDVMELSFRIPVWTNGCIAVNGEVINTREEYYSITKKFDEEEISIVFFSRLLGEGLSDNENVTAILDGPIVLAAIGEEGKHFCLDGRSIEEALTPFVEHTYEAYPWQQSSYKSSHNGTETMFLPVYEVTDEVYTVYIRK